MTWGDSHWCAVQLQPNSRLTGRRSKAHCSHKDWENITWIGSLFFLHIMTHISLLFKLFLLLSLLGLRVISRKLPLLLPGLLQIKPNSLLSPPLLFMYLFFMLLLHLPFLFLYLMLFSSQFPHEGLFYPPALTQQYTKSNRSVSFTRHVDSTSTRSNWGDTRRSARLELDNRYSSISSVLSLDATV